MRRTQIDDIELAKAIYHMNLGEELELDDWYITRVPGGWIYLSHCGHAAFVPFNNEFMQKPTI